MWSCPFKGFEACSAQRAAKEWMVVDLKCFAMTKSGSVSGGGPVKEIKRFYHSAVWIIII